MRMGSCQLYWRLPFSEDITKVCSYQSMCHMMDNLMKDVEFELLYFWHSGCLLVPCCGLLDESLRLDVPTGNERLVIEIGLH